VFGILLDIFARFWTSCPWAKGVRLKPRRQVGLAANLLTVAQVQLLSSSDGRHQDQTTKRRVMKIRTLIVNAGMALTVGWNVWAAPLPVGDNPITGTTAAAQPELAGVVLEDVLVPYDFSGAGHTVKGTVQNRVVRSSVDGTLDFYWRIIPDESSTGGIIAFRVSGFDGFVNDANWRIDGVGDVAPNIARNFGGGSVNFLFPDPGVMATNSSVFFFIDTLANNYASAGQYDLLCASNDCISPLFVAFVPVNAPVDSDGDGVPDVEDQCPNTPAGAVVNASGCSIDQLVPCAGPLSGGSWRNHGAYVSAVAHAAEDFLEAGLITERQKGAIVSAAARSNCGKKAKHQTHQPPGRNHPK
jgi:hypothetical protein